MIQSTRLAKMVYWLSGKVSKIKSYRPTYRLQNEDEWIASEGNMEMMFVKDGYRWSSIQLTWKLMDLAQCLDRVHADHWMYVHDGCGELCDDCGGMECSWRDDE